MNRLMVLLMVAALPAAAQWRHFGDRDARLTGYFGVGVSAPVNPIAAHLNTGWNFTGGVGVKQNYVGVMVSGLFNDFGFDRDTLRDAGARRGSQRYWGLTVDPMFQVNPRGPIDFYLIAGGGVYGQYTQFRSSTGSGGVRYDLISSESVVRPGLNGGAGFQFNLGRDTDPKIFIEARYHHMFTDRPGASFVPVTVGIRF